MFSLLLLSLRGYSKAFVMTCNITIAQSQPGCWDHSRLPVSGKWSPFPMYHDLFSLKPFVASDGIFNQFDAQFQCDKRTHIKGTWSVLYSKLVIELVQPSHWWWLPMKPYERILLGANTLDFRSGSLSSCRRKSRNNFLRWWSQVRWEIYSTLISPVSTGHVEGHRGDATQGGWDWKPPKKCRCETGEVTFEVSEFSIPGFRVRLRDSSHGPWRFTVVSYVPQMTP